MKKGGYSLLETVLVMLLLIFVAFYVFSLTETGSAAYLGLTSRQQETADLRIGLAYIDVRLKSNDASGLVTIAADPFSGQPALLLKQTLADEHYQTWIYVYEGRLYELLSRPGSQLDPLLGNEIARAGRMELARPDQQLIRVQLSSAGPAARSRSRTIRLNSAGEEK